MSNDLQQQQQAPAGWYPTVDGVRWWDGYQWGVLRPPVKSNVVAYLLWFFLGGFGIHRFYLGSAGVGVTMLLLNVVGWALTPLLIGWPMVAAFFVWWVVDAFLIPEKVAAENRR